MEVLFEDTPNQTLGYIVDRLNNDWDIVINKYLEKAPKGLLEFFKEHEEFHIELLRKGVRLFHRDGKYSWSQIRDVLPLVLKKHNLVELEKQLKVCGYDYLENCYDCFQTFGSCDAANNASREIHLMMDLIIYYKTQSDEVKMWSSVFGYIRRDLLQFVNSMRLKDYGNR